MKAPLLALAAIFGSALLVACNADTETTAETTTSTSTTTSSSSTPKSVVAQPLQPDEWSSLEDMAKSIDMINGGCADLSTNAGFGGCGYDRRGIYTLALDTAAYPDQSEAHRMVMITEVRDAPEFAVLGEGWSIHCSEGKALENCTSLEQALDGARLVELHVGPESALEAAAKQDAATAAAANPNSFSDGIHLVGTDIQPGTYRNSGETERCYWARLSGLSGASADILANDNPRGPTYVEIFSTDRAFESKRCGSWEMIE